jgi:hypothetical protein
VKRPRRAATASQGHRALLGHPLAGRAPTTMPDQVALLLHPTTQSSIIKRQSVTPGHQHDAAAPAPRSHHPPPRPPGAPRSARRPAPTHQAPPPRPPPAPGAAGANSTRVTNPVAPPRSTTPRHPATAAQAPPSPPGGPPAPAPRRAGRPSRDRATIPPRSNPRRARPPRSTTAPPAPRAADRGEPSRGTPPTAARSAPPPPTPGPAPEPRAAAPARTARSGTPPARRRPNHPALPVPPLYIHSHAQSVAEQPQSVKEPANAGHGSVNVAGTATRSGRTRANDHLINHQSRTSSGAAPACGYPVARRLHLRAGAATPLDFDSAPACWVRVIRRGFGANPNRRRSVSWRVSARKARFQPPNLLRRPSTPHAELVPKYRFPQDRWTGSRVRTYLLLWVHEPGGVRLSMPCQWRKGHGMVRSAPGRVMESPHRREGGRGWWELAHPMPPPRVLPADYRIPTTDTRAMPPTAPRTARA